MASLFTASRFRALTSDGNPLSGGKVYTYAAGTTTPKATYTTSSGAVANSNPVILDAEGYADIWLDGTYRIDIYSSTDTLLSTTDNVSNDRGEKGDPGTIPSADSGGTVNAITADYTPNITLSDKQLCAFRSSGKNTSTTPTFSPDGLTARTIVKEGGLALEAGDIGGDNSVHLLQYDLANTRWELLNPRNATTQPAFFAYASGAQDNVTGDGTDYTVLFATEITDRGSNFASSTFTAPVTGVYCLSARVKFSGHTSSNLTGRVRIVTSNRTYVKEFTPVGNLNGAGLGSVEITIPCADMDASDTAYVTFTVYDSTKTVDITADVDTSFSGHLVM